MKLSKKDQQHIVPVTYLKHWRISNNENFVYGLDLNNLKYNSEIFKYGLKHKIFKEKKFYNSEIFENKYEIENILGEYFEPNYDKIITEINFEREISENIRKTILIWLYISKMRSRFIRKYNLALNRFIINLVKDDIKKDGVTFTDEELENIAHTAARENQLESLIGDDEELTKQFFNTLLAKNWKILISSSELEFWTNDNPGFSPNLDSTFNQVFPFHNFFELNASSVIYYPLSPKYCLEISPFPKGTSLELNSLNVEIIYEYIPTDFVEFINLGVESTATNIVLSNNKESLYKNLRILKTL